MNKKVKLTITLIIVIIFVVAGIFLFSNDKHELKTIKSEKQLLKIYDGENSEAKEVAINILTMPFSFLVNGATYSTRDIISNANLSAELDSFEGSITNATAAPTKSSSQQKDYSTTNVQVENVDEADIIKTDGDYIYSISGNKVIITDVKNPQEIKIQANITPSSDSVPEDLIIYKNKLVIISAKSTNSSFYSYYNYNSNTIVSIYDIDMSTSSVTLEKNYELYEPYYTSRCIDNMLYVISSGDLRKEDDKIIRTYNEDNQEKEIPLNNIKYLKDIKTTTQSIISAVDLNNTKSDIKINSYLIDISNSYVSENSIYLLDQNYEYDNYLPPIWKLFGPKGVMGFFQYDDDDSSNGYTTEIYKFDITKNGNVNYNTKNKLDGRTINQYSLDEKDNHLRIALYDNNGARVVILDENLRQIGKTPDVAKGETMYSSRFIGNKAYFVTYKTMDPLFVVDLTNEQNPKILGELHIPGYSTYLHPYDENHLIGIGMETEEIVNRNSSGKVISTTDRIIGMKMALFDVSDVNNPTQISQTIIGDRRTTSAILTNPKALLFSKEKELIAIPVNNYSEDFEINSSADTYSSSINSYTSYNKSYVAEGYFVYKINIQDGFNLKGVITHETTRKSNRYSSYYYNSKLLRGVYIDDNLYTVSENAIKVNNLGSLDLVSELKIN